MKRGNFLKSLAGLFTVGAVSAAAKESKVEAKSEKPFEWGERRWVENGMNYIEFTLPSFVPALFMRADKKHAISIPMYVESNINKTTPEMIAWCLGRSDYSRASTHCIIVTVKDKPQLIGIGLTNIDVSLVTDHYARFDDYRGCFT
jgi:hypothetical protein